MLGLRNIQTPASSTRSLGLCGFEKEKRFMIKRSEKTPIGPRRMANRGGHGDNGDKHPIGMPSNFGSLQGWEISEFIKALDPPPLRSTVNKWELEAGNRLDRTCVSCGRRRKYSQMRLTSRGQVGRTCTGCKTKAERRFESRERQYTPPIHTHDSLAADVDVFLKAGGEITRGQGPGNAPWSPASAPNARN